MAEKKIIQLATLEKQIEILDKIDFTKDEMLVAIGNEHGDIITLLSQKIDSLIEAEDQKLVEQLARTLLANQSEASVQYVLSHELVGPVFKYILKSNNDDFDSAKINDVIVDNDMMEEIVQNDQLAPIVFNSTYFITQINKNNTASKLCGTNAVVLEYILNEQYARTQLKNNEHLSKGITSNSTSLAVAGNNANGDVIFGTNAFKTAVDDGEVLSMIVGDTELTQTLLNRDKFVWAVAHSNIWFDELYQDKYMDILLSNPSASYLSINNDKWADKLARKNNGWLTYLLDGTGKFKNADSNELRKKIQSLNTLRKGSVSRDDSFTVPTGEYIPSHKSSDYVTYNAYGKLDGKHYDVGLEPLGSLGEIGQISKGISAYHYKKAAVLHVYYYNLKEMA